MTILCIAIFLYRTNVSRNDGGLGNMKIPLLADKTKSIAADYVVLIENDGIALRLSFFYMCIL